MPLRRLRATLLLLVLAAALPASASFAATQPSIFSIKDLPGETVAEAHTDAAETVMGLQGYRVERVRLQQAATVNVEGRSVETRVAWRVTVYFGRPLVVRDQLFSLAVDGHWCGALQEAPDVLSAATVCFNGALFKEGAAVGVTYRSISIVPPADSNETAPRATVFAGDEDIHYSSVRLRIGGQR
jgi:hypothetical protein